MALVHVHLIRAINAIYLQAPNIKDPKDIKDFTTFMHAWCEVVHDHHHHEEEYFFPWIEEYIGIPGYMQVNVDQHHEFEPGKLEFQAYVKGVREGTEKYDGQRVQKLIDAFAPTLAQHLSDEIDFLVGLEKFDKIDWTAVNKRITDFAVKHTDAVSNGLFCFHSKSV
jgi:hemerythrin-like domain-containing protein